MSTKKILFVFYLQILTVVAFAQDEVVAFAQDGYVRGYIINFVGDTVKGTIKDRKYPKNLIGWQKINFINEKGEKDKFTADDIRGYSKNNSSSYRSLALGVEGTKRFAQILESGAVVLFAYSLGLSQKAPPDYFLQKTNDVNSLMEWREVDYKKTANYFFKENKDMIKLIESESLKHDDIQKIVKDYNEWKFKQ